MRSLCVILCCALLGSIAQASLIDYIIISQSTGSSADYNATEGALTWTGGGFSYIYTEGGNFISFDSAEFTVQFDLYSDDSAGGVAKARFNLVGDMTVDLYQGETKAVTITAAMYTGSGNPFGGRYWEERTGDGALDGKAWVTITGISANGLGNLEWANDNIAGMDTDITLFSQTDIASYADSYSAPNGLTVTLFADQSQVVPEPATLALLGLGGLALFRKRS